MAVGRLVITTRLVVHIPHRELDSSSSTCLWPIASSFPISSLTMADVANHSLRLSIDNGFNCMIVVRSWFARAEL